MDTGIQEIEEMDNAISLRENLEKKVIAYYTDIWRDQRHSEYQKWLDNFKDGEDEKLNALFLLSKFIYFGSIEIRALLKSIFRDLYKYPIIERIRRDNKDTTDDGYIKQIFKNHLKRTRFLGVGNPSESGVHLLYYFRQENMLSKQLFVHAHELFKSTYSAEDEKMILTWGSEEINHIVFIDDFCGDGSQAIGYIKDLVKQIKELNNACQIDYFVMVANKEGLKNVKKDAGVDNSKAIFELDESFKCFADNARYFVNAKKGINKDFCKKLCEKYGKERASDAKSPFGFNDDELLLSFFHNTPNNTLPIFWTEEKGWYPIFNRNIKIYR